MEFCCGFARVAIRERNLHNCEDGVGQFKELFPKFDQDQQTFEKKARKVIEGFNSRWKGENKVAKNRFLETFSSEKWKALSKYEQNAHTATDCVYCTLFYADVYFSFPKTSEWARDIQKQAILIRETVQNLCKTLKKVGTSPRICAKGVQEVVDASFEDVYKIPMTAVLRKVHAQSAAKEENMENNLKPIKCPLQCLP